MRALRSRLDRDALLVFGTAATLVVAVSVGFQLWMSASGAGDLGGALGTVATLLAGGVVLVAAAVHVRLVRARLRRLLRALEAARRGEHSLIVASGEDEVAELAVGFNQLVEQLRLRGDKPDGEGSRVQAPLSPPAPLAKERLGHRLEGAGEGVVVLDREGRVIVASAQVRDILGVPAAELVGVELPVLLEQVQHRIVDGVRVRRDLPDGEREPTAETVIALDGPAGPSIRVYATPLGDEHAPALGRIAALIEGGKEREVERLKSDFMSTISHELRTPLTSVKGALGLIRGGVAGQVNEDVRELLDIASINIDRLITVINNILDVLSLERGQATLRFAPTSLARCLEHAAEVVGEAGERSGVTLEWALPDDLPPVRGDGRRLEQVLVNLLSNAIKFSSDGQRVVVSAAAENGTVTVSVRDQGRGIGKEAMRKLFRRFEHTEGALTRGSQGAGLGLAICRHIVEAHGGRIWAESTEGEGSTFSFSLPAEPQPHPQPQPTPQAARRSSGADGLVEARSRR